MCRIVLWILVGTTLCGLAAEPIGAGEASENAGRSFDEIELLDHTRLPGLIESVDDDWLTLIRIQTPRGEQMHLVIQPFARSQILSFTRLDADKRAALERRIAEFRNRASIEAANMEAVKLETREADGNSYRHYASKWFTLDSTADEQNTRRMIVRAQQIFAAYRQIVPPRVESPQPPRLVVLGSMEQYQPLLSKLGLKMKIENPACFLEDRNVVVVGSDLARLTALTARIAPQNASMRKELRDLEESQRKQLADVAQNLKQGGFTPNQIAQQVNLERAKLAKQLQAKRDELRKSDQQIERFFKANASQTLVRLYHEAFHAYLRNNVYPRQQYDVPPWLNEGLAVIFEGGQLEGTTLRVDAPNAAALKKLRADLAGPQPLKLEKLLAAGEGSFLVTDAARSAAVDRYYVYAWGLAYYLTFDKHLLGSPELEKYLQSGNARLAQGQRLEQLLGGRLEQIEKDWRAYIGALGREP
jgi:hypothetical protein